MLNKKKKKKKIRKKSLKNIWQNYIKEQKNKSWLLILILLISWKKKHNINKIIYFNYNNKGHYTNNYIKPKN